MRGCVRGSAVSAATGENVTVPPSDAVPDENAAPRENAVPHVGAGPRLAEASAASIGASPAGSDIVNADSAPAATDVRGDLGGREWIAPVLVGAVVTAIYVAYAAWQWSAITVSSWDHAIFTQLIQRYAAFEAPIVPVKGDGFHLLGDHFHPLLALLGPVYALCPHAFTLLVIQAVCFGAAAAVIAWGARGVGVGRVVSALFGVAFGLSWGLQGAAEVQFHEIALAVPLLAASLVALLRGRWLATALWAAPLVFVKEDLGLTVVAIGAVLAWRSRRPASLWLCVWGLGWFAIASLVVLPLLNPDGAWQYAGSVDPLRVLTDPAILFAEQKFRTVGLLLLITVGAGLRSPILLVVVPTIAWRFLSANHGYWGPTWHYSAVLMPIVFVAVLDGIRILRRSTHRLLAVSARASAWASVAVAAVLLPILPLWALVDGRAAQENPRAESAWEVLDAVPDDAVVESDLGLLAYVAERRTTFWIGNDNPAPDCVLVDLVAGGTPREWGADAVAVGAARHPEAEFALVIARDGYELACAPDASP